MWLQKKIVKQLAGALVLACGFGVGSSSLVAQAGPAVVLVMDETAIDHGPPPHLISPDAANDAVANVGLRDQIPYFTARVGDSITLPSGDGAGNDGWFALRSVPTAWASEPGLDDGLQNYLLAGAGLGSPNAEGSRTSLLTSVADVVPLRAAGLSLLVGRQVCAVVYDADLAVTPGTPSTADLSGVNLGVVAFQVTSVDASGAEWPAITVQILDAHDTCGGDLAAFAQAPDPVSPPAP